MKITNEEFEIDHLRRAIKRLEEKQENINRRNLTLVLILGLGIIVSIIL